MQLPHTNVSLWVEKQVTRLGDLVSWIWLVLLATIVVNVVMRYLFGQGRIEFEEIQWHLYAIGFLLGLSYAYVSDIHIRVDVVREKLSEQAQAWIELYGIVLLLLPFVILVLYGVIPFISYSLETNEVSEAPAGLPFRWIIKSFLAIGFLLLLVATIARLSRIWCFLFGWPHVSAVQEPHEESN
ncbi:MAG TPA: TRAP transporter small permease subunit [Pseudomonadales bacterium]|nr:C4-dicarboxylate ABC transporter permease [Gammaproteobacteria bacterium]MDP6026885.1 TRAP transporter small permease subunit [Pseudomonadales bacterium]MDP6316388.1 TRAP transporter small permease subunit [Pseudomonadales bacterium]MDP7314978.1 TRAP transporter small permease subunit [Pseudomonadales bacterium]HJL61131.1 TRAP transporter small permease subunit [Pseudomonadales bacterium]